MSLSWSQFAQAQRTQPKAIIGGAGDELFIIAAFTSLYSNHAWLRDYRSNSCGVQVQKSEEATISNYVVGQTRYV